VAQLGRTLVRTGTAQAIGSGSFNSTQRLEQAIMRWFDHWNHNAKPFCQ
jgi:hypothetical protein